MAFNGWNLKSQISAQKVGKRVLKGVCSHCCGINNMHAKPLSQIAAATRLIYCPPTTTGSGKQIQAFAVCRRGMTSAEPIQIN